MGSTDMDIDAPPCDITAGSDNYSCVRGYLEELYSNDAKKRFNGVMGLKVAVIGSLKMKGTAISEGCVAKLLQILKAPDAGIIIKAEVVIVLNSLAKGLPEHTASLVTAGVLPVLWEQLEICDNFNDQKSLGVKHCLLNKTNDTFEECSEPLTAVNNTKLTQAINKYTSMLLCCLQSLYRQGCVPPPFSWNFKKFTTLIKYGYSSPVNQECVANILAFACKGLSSLSSSSDTYGKSTSYNEHQSSLYNVGAGCLVAFMLTSELTVVQLPALHCLSALVRNNPVVSKLVVALAYQETSVLTRLQQLLRLYSKPVVQLGAATVLVWLYKAGALTDTYACIRMHVPQVLIVMMKEEQAMWLRVQAAFQLANLLERSPSLQSVAAQTDHLTNALHGFLNAEVGEGAPLPDPKHLSPYWCGQFDEASLLPDLMKEAALLVYAALTANSEHIRQKVIYPPSESPLLGILEKTLASGTPVLKLAAAKCLLSVSRSVYALRIVFQDSMMWQELLDIVEHKDTDEKLLLTALSTVCNLVLDSSPNKQDLVARGCVQTFCKLTKRDNNDIKLNAVWALFNCAYKSDITVKVAIMNDLSSEQILDLISSTDEEVVMKAVGLLRNVLADRQDVDTIMESYAGQVMQYLVLILEGQYSQTVKEQALCVYCNVADGYTAKAYIMGNEDVLKKIANYMSMAATELQLAATKIILTLVEGEGEEAMQRVLRLKALKFPDIVQSLLATPDHAVYDRIALIMEQFKQYEVNREAELHQSWPMDS